MKLRASGFVFDAFSATPSIFILAFLCVACGNTPKKDPPTEKDKNNQIVPCSPQYDPLNLQRSDLFPISDLSSLPNGKYSHLGIQMVLRLQNTITKNVSAVGHFEENFRGGSVLLKEICKSSVAADLLASADFLGVKVFTQIGKEDGTQLKSISAIRFLVTIENGKMNMGRIIDDSIENAGLEKFLQSFSTWRLYQVSPNEYELRARKERLEGTSMVTTTIVQKLQYTPN